MQTFRGPRPPHALMRWSVTDYDVQASTGATILRLTRSVVPATVCRREFLLFFVLHVLAVLLFRWGRLPGFQHDSMIIKVTWGQVQVITMITVFILVFYTQACFKRYFTLYKQSRQLMKQLTVICFDTRLHLMASEPKYARLSTRYVLASLCLFFQSLNRRREVEELHRILTDAGLALMLPEERVFLAQFEESERYLITMAWAIEVLQQGGAAMQLPLNITLGLVGSMFKFSESMQVITSTSDMLVPFPYFHLLNLMVCVNMASWAYFMASTMSYTSIVVYLLSELIFMGMLVLASQLADPFGNDRVDFPLTTWVLQAFADAVDVLEYKRDILLKHPHVIRVSETLTNVTASLRAIDMALLYNEAFSQEDRLRDQKENEQEEENEREDNEDGGDDDDDDD